MLEVLLEIIDLAQLSDFTVIETDVTELANFKEKHVLQEVSQLLLCLYHQETLAALQPESCF